MKLAARLLAIPLLSPFLQWSALAATTVSIDSCQDLQDAAAATASGDVVAEFNTTLIDCDSWTTVEVTDNRLKLVVKSGVDADTLYLYHIRFLVSTGPLRVEPGLVLGALTADTDGQEVNGGVLYVAEGASAKFVSGVSMLQSVLAATDEDSDVSWSGGCIYNEGLIRFLSSLDTESCSTGGGDGSIAGDGGTIWNGESGKIFAKGAMNLRGDWQSNSLTYMEGSRGGTIFNKGKFFVLSSAQLYESKASAGGSIYNEGVFAFRKDSYPLFFDNFAGGDVGGGHVVNSGTMKFKGGVQFHFGVALYGDGGAVVNTGTLIISDPAEFIDTSAERYGGAIATTTSATLKLPDDTVFDGTYVAGRYQVYDCDIIYIADEDGGYTCEP